MRRKQFWEGYRLATNQAISLVELLEKHVVYRDGSENDLTRLIGALKQQLNGSWIIEREEKNE